MTSHCISISRSQQEAQISYLQKYPPLHHLKPELLHLPSRLLEHAQMSHNAHLTLSFFISVSFRLP